MTTTAQQLRESIRLLERKLGILKDTEFSCCGISFAQCHALVEIGRANCLSLVDLAQMLNLDNSTMSRTISNLVNGGYAQREIDPDDRRYVRIKLTQSGQTLFESIEGNMGSYYETVFNEIPHDKRAQVLDSLHVLLDAVGRLECCAGKGTDPDSGELTNSNCQRNTACCGDRIETEV